MRDDKWRDLDDEALEHRLVERWLYRGLMLGVILLAAIAVTYLGLRGVATRADWVTITALLALGLAAAGLAFTMRQEDLRIIRELRRRRSPQPRGTP
jgi:hypothetical protein